MSRRSNCGSLLLILLLCLPIVASAAADKPKKTKRAKKAKPAPAASSEQSGGKGPSSDDPGRLLEPLWTEGPTIEWRAAAADLCSAAELALADLGEHPPAAKKSDFLKLGRLAVSLIQLQRLAERLQVWSEPAGLEFSRRNQVLKIQLAGIMEPLRETSQAQLEVFQQQFLSLCDKKQIELKKIRQLRDQGKPEEAEQRILRLWDDLYVVGYWFPGEAMVPFTRASSDLALDAQRSQQADEAFATWRAAEASDLAAFKQQVEQAVSAMKDGQQVRVDGRKLNGPQSLAYFFDRWQKLNLKCLHVLALDMARGDPARVAQTRSAHDEFNASIVGALAKLLDAESENIEPSAVAAKYLAYQSALGSALASTPDNASTEPFYSALERLAAKDPAFAATTAAYRLGTSDWLRWRNRWAAAQAEQARGQQKSVVPQLAPALLTEPAADSIRALKASVVGKMAVGQALIGSSTTSTAASALDAPSIYYIVPIDDKLKDASAHLEAGLLSSRNDPPLALEAAVALARTERGDCVEMGGTITRVELLPLVPLWAHATETDEYSLRRQQLPHPGERRAADIDLWKQFRLRVEMKPRWCRLPHTFVEVTSQ